VVVTDDQPHVYLARSWNIPEAAGPLTQTAHAAACHWRHSMPELESAIVPTNTLFLRFKPTRAVRISGAKTERSVYPRGGIGLMAEGSSGRWLYQDSVDILHIYVSGDQLSTLASQHDIGTRVALRDQINIDDPFLQALCVETATACREGEIDPLYVDTLSLAIGLRLIRSHALVAPPSNSNTKSSTGGLADWQLARARDRMLSAVDDSLSLSDLAGDVRLSPFHFARAFKASTGLPPHRYFRQLRIERARSLLETTDLAVAEIAARIGYDDPSYLARLFRKHFGATPAAYRRERRS
jgi:AraC family transcriptional regulator